MADVLDRKERSKLMSKIKGINTKPIIHIVSFLFSLIDSDRSL